MKTTFLIAAAIGLGTFGQAETLSVSSQVTRKALLATNLVAIKSVSRVEIKSITLAPGVRAGRHLHPCPVVGVVMEGSIEFQIEGFTAQHLRAGDAFYEPANVRVLHFDNEAGDKPATFAAFYLLDQTEHELIRMLKD